MSKRFNKFKSNSPIRFNQTCNYSG